MLKTLQQEFSALSVQKQNFLYEALKFVKDKEYDLEDRWLFFRHLVNSGFYFKKAPYYFSPLQNICREINWHDDFYVDRYQTVDLVSWLYDAQDYFDKEEIKRLKEYILQEGYSHFEMDW